MSEQAKLSHVESAGAVDDPDQVALRPRDVRFDWSQLPMHWVPDDPFTTHLFNVLHLLLPEGERWFVQVFSEALPLVKDEQLAEDVRGFIGQEAIHAESHQGVLDHFAAHGLDPEPYVGQVRWLFRKALGDRDFTGKRNAAKRREEWLVERAASVAAIEHFTAFLGDLILNSPGLDAAHVDPVMLDLLRWHGAEEVEHRSVAFELFMHVDGSYRRRARTWATAFTALVFLWQRGARFFMANDPTLVDGRAGFKDFYLRGRRGTLPTTGDMLRSIPRYLSRTYHPSQEGCTEQAVAYLASSPAATAAEAAEKGAV